MSPAAPQPGPAPRFRLYTRAAGYGEIARDLLQALGTRGDDGARLERAVAEGGAALPGAGPALSLPRARTGIFLALRALLEPGQEVILSPYTIHEVVNMVICAGGVPVFADIERETCNLDPKQVERLLGPRTGAVLATHLHGLALDLDGTAALCRARGVALLEDCAQAFGTRRGGRPVGSSGDVGIYSFGTYKNVCSFLGGMLVTRHRELHERLAAEQRRLPWQPLGPLLAEVALGLATDVATWPPLFRRLTFPLFRLAHLRDWELLNRRVRVEDDPQLRTRMPAAWLCRPRPLQARLALRGLPAVAADLEARVAAARRYDAGLRGLPELLRPPLREDGSHGYSYYPIQVPDRQALVRHLMREGRDVAVQHLRNCADLPCFARFARDCPNARATAAATVLLPTYPGYGEVEVARNVAAIRAFFGRGGEAG